MLYMEPGDHVDLTPVDPWDLVTAIGSGPFRATLNAIDESTHETIVFKLDKPLTYKELTVEFFRAYTRHFGEKFVKKPTPILCNLDSISEREANAAFHPQCQNAESAPKRDTVSLTGDIKWVSFKNRETG